MFELTKAERDIQPLSAEEIRELIAEFGDQVDGHALFAPSAAPMWMRCAGSLLLRAKMGDGAGIDAAMGTVAHWVAEVWNKSQERPNWLLGTKRHAYAGGNRYDFVIDEEMLDYIELFVNWCAEVPGDHYYEQKVDLSPFLPIPNQRGTADHFACEFGVLTITDLKYGTGVRVYAEGNYQALCYALAVFHEWDWIYGFQHIVIRICHPRLDVFDVWQISRADLLMFGEFLRIRAVAAYRRDAPRTPSKKACEWCEGRKTCPARIRELEQIIDDTLDDLEEDYRDDATFEADDLTPESRLTEGWGRLPRKLAEPIQPLSTETLSYTYTLRSHVEKWFKAIGEELLARAEAGESLPHQKLVDGRTQHQWKDKVGAVRFLTQEYGVGAEKLFPVKVVSPNQAKKIAREVTKKRPVDIERDLKKFISSHAGKRTLAPMKDERVDSYSLAEDAAEDGEDEDDEEL